MAAECRSLGSQVTSAVLRFVLGVVMDGAGRDVRGLTASAYKRAN